MKNTTKRTIKIIVRAITLITSIITFPVGVVLSILAAGTFDYAAKYDTTVSQPWTLLIVGAILLFTTLMSVLIYEHTFKK